jgi:hypothetical protein
VNAVVHLRRTLYAFSAKDLTGKGERKRYLERMYLKEKQIEKCLAGVISPPRPSAGGESIEKTYQVRESSQSSHQQKHDQDQQN